MIKKEFGVRISALNRQEWPGLVRTILDMRWETEPGWIAFSFDAPVLCVVRLYECARLLGEHGATNDLDVYGFSLARALQVTLLGVTLRRLKPRTFVKLTGARLADFLAYINDHIDQSTAVEDLARIADMSSAQFGRCFREATGMSLQRWRMDARIRSAQRLMVDEPAESLAGIASLVGFSDSSHFTRAFLEVVGTTPSAWLRQRI